MRKVNCEICGYAVKSALHAHHMVPVSRPGSTNHPNNLIVLCANCHNEVHAGDKIIEGRFLTSSGVRVFWRLRDQEPLVAEGYLV